MEFFKMFILIVIKNVNKKSHLSKNKSLPLSCTSVRYSDCFELSRSNGICMSVWILLHSFRAWEQKRSQYMPWCVGLQWCPPKKSTTSCPLSLSGKPTHQTQGKTLKFKLYIRFFPCASIFCYVQESIKIVKNAIM